MNRFQKIGELTSDPVKVDAQGKLVISYTTQQVCSFDKNSNYSTVINLTCNKNAVSICILFLKFEISSQVMFLNNYYILSYFMLP